MDPATLLIVLVVVAALAFDFCNGWNDSANAIATVVSTRVLSPLTAVLIAALLNFAGAFLSEGVAKTIGKGIVDPALVTQAVVLASMLAATVWVALMTLAGMPISGSHSLIGSLVGAAAFATGFDAIQSEGLTKTLIAMLVSPVAGFGFGFLVMLLILYVCRYMRPSTVGIVFGKLQLVSVSLMAGMHGMNDAQKVMGVITLALIAGKFLPADANVPLWVKVACATMMGVGTLAGGWKVIKTLGMGLIKIKPVHGCAAETGASITLGVAAYMGVPVSTTHTITGSIMGVGATRRLSAVSWGVGTKILVAWVLTLPCTALFGGLVYGLLRLLGLDAAAPA